ncbi:hypothetical protein HAX54_021772 [Datura stramonium]|uniref:Uncharacterized protein n=1 Tax=Datura stramonium TaxID=4076 RepID=A0ABS8UUR1_DATST|nr:hypothetical protein [Datura stramonium]
MVNCHFKGDCRCLYFPSTITHLVSLFDVNLEGLPNIENTYFIVRNFIDGLNPPAGPTKDVQEKIIIESLEKTENEIAQPEHSEVGTTPTAFLPDILDPGSSGGHVVGTNLYAVQEQSIFAPPFPTMMFDLNKGSGSTPIQPSFNDHQYNTFCDLATIHGMAISSLSVPVQLNV